ncbi:MAG: MFS transporter [Propionicimonas sp.]
MAAVPAPTPSRRGLVVGLLLIVVAIAFEATAVVTAMPAAVDDLGNLDLYAWAFTGFVIAQTLSIVAAGQAADRFGPVRPLIAGFVIFAVGLALAGAATSMGLLVVARTIQGLGGGTMNLAVMVLVGRAFDGRERASLMTAFSAAWMVPAFAGPPLAAWLAETWSWHWVFWSVLPVLLMAGLLVIRPLLGLSLPAHPEAVQTPRRHLPMALLVAAGAASLQWAGQRIEPASLLWLIVGLGLLIWGLPPLMPAGFLLTGRGLSAVVTVRALTSGAFFGAQTFLPLMFTTAWGLSLQWAAATMIVGSVGWMTGAWLQSRPWLRFRRDTIIVIGAVLTAVGLLAVASAALLPGPGVVLVMAGWTCCGVGMGLSSASTSLAVMQLSETVALGRNTSSLQVGEALGNSLSAGIAGTLYVIGGGGTPSDAGFGALMVAMMVISGLAVLSSVRIGHVENHSVTL